MATHVCIGLTRDVPVERDSNIITVLLLLLFQINIHSNKHSFIHSLIHVFRSYRPGPYPHKGKGVCVRDVCAIYDNNISPSLLMIIIKIIILYFIQIRHTDDFPPTGTLLV